MDIADFSSSRHVHAFTPVRRREYPIYTQQDDQGIEWTTARCHRLLRALTSRVAILTKDLARYSAVNHPSSDTNRRVVDAKSPDGDWGKTKKKIRQTYSSKGRKSGNRYNAEKSRMLPPKQGRQSLIPGEVLVPTPVLTRARREYSEDEPHRTSEPELEEQNIRQNKRRRTRYGANESMSSFQLSENLRDLRQKTSAARFTTYEGIYNGLEALLVATAPAQPEAKRKGTRSLFAMALRAVPKYIAQQESLIKAHVEETGSRSALTSRDMSTEIYDELEDFGLFRSGWKHLKTVVRSHGIQVVQHAIEAGLLEIGFVGCLVTLCMQVYAMDEAQSLFSALLFSSQFAPPRSLYERPNRRLSMLWRFTEHTGKLPFQYRELSGLFKDGFLPLEWVATKSFGPVWTELFQALSAGSENIEALFFLDTLLPLLSSAVSNADGLGTSNSIILEAVTNTFSSLLTTLSSIIILSREREPPNVLGLATHPRYTSRLLNSSKTRMEQEPWTAAVLPLLATLLTRGTIDDKDDVHLIDFLAKKLQYERNNDSKSYNKIVQFTCSIARCCGRGALNSGFDYLQHLHGLLEACDKGMRTNIFKSLIVDSAFAFAEQTPDSVHLQYAAKMDSRFNVRRFEPESGSCNISDMGGQMSGFRWEEGIGEWVSASPFAVKKSAISIPNQEESGCDTPYRPPPNLRRKLEKEPLPTCKSASLPVAQVVINVAKSQMTCGDNLGFEVEYDHFSDQNPPESGDELGPESSQTSSSFVSDLSFDGAEMSFAEESFASSNSSLSLTSTKSVVPRRSVERAPRLSRKALVSSQDWAIFGDSSPMAILSAEPPGGTETRQFIDKAPRLGRKALRSSQTYQIFIDNESDDELSFVSATSSFQGQAEEVLLNATDTSINTRRLRQRVENEPAPPVPKMLKSKPKPAKRRIISVTASDSEDELCI